MSFKLDIQSYVGVGKLHFGLSQGEIAQLIGASTRQKKGFSGELTEYRRENGLLTTYDRDTKKLIEIGFSRNILELEYVNKKLFTDPPFTIFSELIKLDGQPYESLGFIVLLNLGITLTGFHDGDVNQQAVTVFARGRWDDLLNELKPFAIGAN
ncbi:hypothetical protein [Massilia antarctica]|uniref:hypothetical protein n=1 Tax=Massilia antarctica TaxID=2765360 RepID=UPI002271D26E|nr:hypothetical protein [Massilia sp. H27-R4]MCY0916346.1 hypothetical protein [Massilia sp. H27-R4]